MKIYTQPNKQKIIFFCLFLFLFNVLQAQEVLLCFNNVVLNISLGNIQKAHKYADKAISIIENGQSKYPTDTADAYLSKALIYIKLLQTEEAEPYIVKSFEAYQRVKNKEKEPLYLMVVSGISSVYVYQHKYTKAIPILENYVDSLDAQIKRGDVSELPKTEIQIMYLKKDENRKKPKSNEEASLVMMLNTLSGIYLISGEFNKAIANNDKAFSIAKEWKETMPLFYLQCLMYKLVIMSHSEEYATANEVITETLEYNRFLVSQLVIKPEVYTLMLNNYVTISGIYYSLGNPYKSIEILKEEEAFYNQTNNKNMAIKIQIYNDLGKYYLASGDYKNAEKYITIGVDLAKKHFSEKSLDYYRYAYYLPLFYSWTEKYDKSKTLFEDFIHLQTYNHDTISKAYFESISNYIQLRDYMNITEKTDSIENRLLTILEPYKNVYPDIYYLHIGLKGKRLYNKEEYLAAEPYLWTYLMYYYQDFSKHISNYQESNLEKGINNIYFFQNIYNSLYNKIGKDKPNIIHNIANMSLLAKNYYMNNKIRIRTNLENHPNIAVRDSFKLLKVSYNQIKKLENNNLLNNPNLEKEIESETFKSNALLAWLKREVPNIMLGVDTNSINTTIVRGKLKKGEATINIRADSLYDKQTQQQYRRYSATVIINDSIGSDIELTLNDTVYINAIHQQYLDNLQNKHGGIKAYPNEMKEYYHIFWSQIDTILYKNNIHTVYIAPDGIYNEIDPYTFINYGIDSTFSLKLNVHIISNPSNLSVLKIDTISHKIAYLYANPDCDSLKIDDMVKNEKDKTRADFSNLPDSEVEVDSIQKILYQVNIIVKVAKRNEVTETLLRTVKSPYIFHFAGHGYVKTIARSKAVDNLHDCFLSLAGSKISYNSLEKKGLENSTEYDGILTGMEISGLEISNTYLTVLSACESAVGKIQYNEGVWGLQRAFFIAGSQHVIASLWKIEDEGAKKFMTMFYTKWLIEKEDIYTAFKHTKLAMMQVGEPSYIWAAFVLYER